MTTLRKAAQAALDALSVTDYQTVGEFFSICVDVRDNLRAALAEFDASLTDPTKISVHQTAEPAQPVAWKELLREARDNCKASIAEDGISAMRREYRVELEARLTAALAAAPPATAAPARLTDEYFATLWLASTSDVDVSKSFAALAFHYGRAVEDEVRRRMEVSA